MYTWIKDINRSYPTWGIMLHKTVATTEKARSRAIFVLDSPQQHGIYRCSGFPAELDCKALLLRTQLWSQGMEKSSWYDLEASSMLTSFHSTRGCHSGCWGGGTGCGMSLAAIASCEPIIMTHGKIHPRVQWWRECYRAANNFLIEFRAGSTGGNKCLAR